MESALTKGPRYDETAISCCIELITSKQKTVYGACKAYGIPQSTIRYRMSEKWSSKVRKGPPTVLTEDEERKLKQYLIAMGKKGFPVVKELLLHKVKSFLDSNLRKTPFKNNVPGIFYICIVKMTIYKT